MVSPLGEGGGKVLVVSSRISGTLLKFVLEFVCDKNGRDWPGASVAYIVLVRYLLDWMLVNSNLDPELLERVWMKPCWEA